MSVIKPKEFYCHVSCRDEGFVERTLGHGDAEALEVLEGVWNNLESMKDGGQRPTSWEDCVSWARRKWETLYNNDICQLLHCFPPEQVKSLQGEKTTTLPQASVLWSCNLCLWTQRGTVVFVRSSDINQWNAAMWH